MVNIREQLIPVGTKRRSGIPLNKVIFFVDHDTGNADSTARNNVTYYINSANDMSASAHVFIDDKEAIICIPCLQNPEKAWHVKYDKVKDNALYGDDANDIAIGLELCYFPQDQQRSLKAYKNYIEVAAYLCNLHNVPPDKRSGHFELDPERRTDPNNALKYIGKTYDDMKKDIVAKYNELYVEQEAIQTSNPNKEAKTIITIPKWAEKEIALMTELGINDGEITSEEEIKTTVYFARTYEKIIKPLIDRIEFLEKALRNGGLL